MQTALEVHSQKGLVLGVLETLMRLPDKVSLPRMGVLETVLEKTAKEDMLGWSLEEKDKLCVAVLLCCGSLGPQTNSLFFN